MNQEISHLLKQVQSSWPKDVIIRYLYIKLAPCFKRDLKYFLAPEEVKEVEYAQGFINRFPDVVCSTLADFYVNLFKEYDIQAQKVVANSAKIPLYALVVRGEQGLYFLDPLSDLFANQYGLRPYFFGIVPRYKTINYAYPKLAHLPKDYVAEIDTFLGFQYLNEYFETLHLSLANRNNAYHYFEKDKNNEEDLRIDKINLYNEKLINLGQVQGTFERAQLYIFLNDTIMNKSEKKYTKVTIEQDKKAPYISYEIIQPQQTIHYEEENQQGKYVLVRK